MAKAKQDNCINQTQLPSVIAFGNVLLDISAKIDDIRFLKVHNLELDGQGEVDNKKLDEIIDLMKKQYEVSYNTGGSALNTCRILKSLNLNALFFGAVGNDDIGKTVKEHLENAGINKHLQVIKNYPTGQCICLIHGDKRTLYANIGASIKITKEFLEESENEFYIGKSSNKVNDINQFQVFYIEGFFVTQRYAVCKYIIERYILRNTDSSNNILLAFNLSSPYIIRENILIIKNLIEHATFIFGNRDEFLTLGKTLDSFTYNSFDDIARKLTSDSNKKRIIVVTNGSDDVFLYSNYNHIHDIEKRYPKSIRLQKIPDDKIVDTTGAGDSFVAGFLNAFFNNETLDACVAEGCRIASLVVQQIGCKIE